MKIVDLTTTVLASYEYPNGGWVLVRVQTEAGVEGAGFPRLAGKMNRSKARVIALQRLKFLLGSVRASIVYDDDLVGLLDALQNGYELIEQRGEVFFLIVRGNNDGELRRSRQHRLAT